ncbi:putative F-box protein [Cardamine amara subsp. amara]|uniref:F-box protein n=1 Tax=Cardamine amara subsp. amara TaxID=228776 RepID=A0ABD0Z1G2_CARAN
MISFMSSFGSSKLTSLGLVICEPTPSKGLVNAVSKLPLLQVLEVSVSRFKLDLKAIGNACTQLKTLKLNSSCYIICDDDALAIAETMPQPRHLQLFGNAILDGCPHLGHLDLQRCFNICFAGDIEKRFFERIKNFRHPNDPNADDPFDTGFVNIDVDDASELNSI